MLRAGYVLRRRLWSSVTLPRTWFSYKLEHALQYRKAVPLPSPNPARQRAATSQDPATHTNGGFAPSPSVFSSSASPLPHTGHRPVRQPVAIERLPVNTKRGAAKGEQ